MATAYTGPRTEEKTQTPDSPARTSWRYLGGSPRLIAPMPTVARAPAANARTAVPAMKTSMVGAAAHSTDPTTVTAVKQPMRWPTSKRDSSHAPIGIMRNIGACAAASSGPYRWAPSSSVASSGSTVCDR